MLAQVAQLPHVDSGREPLHGRRPTRSRSDGTIGFATVLFDERANVLPVSPSKVISTARGRSARPARGRAERQAIEQTEFATPTCDTRVGVLAAIVVLLISFGSFLAMGLPVVTALLRPRHRLALIGLGSHVLDMPNFSIELARMIGLGVGIDYALFILTRFREIYRENGGHVEQAVGLAMDTAGRAVLFAGVTVVIALLGMFALGVSFLYGLSIAASLAVLLVLAASVTLLPALLTFFGRRVGDPDGRLGAALSQRPSRRLPGRPADSASGRAGSRVIQRRPAVAAIGSGRPDAGAGGAGALRCGSGSSDAGNDPTSFTTRRAYDLLAQGFGPGFNGPLSLVVEASPRRRHGGLGRSPQRCAARRTSPRSRRRG